MKTSKTNSMNTEAISKFFEAPGLYYLNEIEITEKFLNDYMVLRVYAGLV
jgi:hypothetical protein